MLDSKLEQHRNVSALLIQSNRRQSTIVCKKKNESEDILCALHLHRRQIHRNCTELNVKCCANGFPSKHFIAHYTSKENQ